MADDRNVDVIDLEGKKAGSVVLPGSIFDVPTNIPLMHQVVVAQLAAARQGTHATKTRGEVAGGGKKPFRQKGTGNARQGSGSIGACATPGRIFKGLRMAGRMGGNRRTVQNLTIQAVDTEKGLLLISGAIPGPKNGVVLVRSSVKGA